MNSRGIPYGLPHLRRRFHPSGIPGLSGLRGAYLEPQPPKPSFPDGPWQFPHRTVLLLEPGQLLKGRVPLRRRLASLGRRAAPLIGGLFLVAVSTGQWDNSINIGLTLAFIAFCLLLALSKRQAATRSTKYFC